MSKETNMPPEAAPKKPKRTRKRTPPRDAKGRFKKRSPKKKKPAPNPWWPF